MGAVEGGIVGSKQRNSCTGLDR